MRSPTGKRIRLRPGRANAGVGIAYANALDRELALMNRSILYWMRAAYRENTPEMALDASPATELAGAFKKLAAQWQKRFDKLADLLANAFAKKTIAAVDASLKSALRKGGMSVKFQMSRKTNDVLQATVVENVGLIKSIASEHLTDVQGLVMQSVTRGRDLQTLTAQIEERYGLTRKRALLIAQDQNNKATSQINAARQIEVGITHGQWLHSAGGKVPRKSHVAASREKVVFSLSKGALIDGEYIMPGELINCRCTWIPILDAQ